MADSKASRSTKLSKSTKKITSAPATKKVAGKKTQVVVDIDDEDAMSTEIVQHRPNATPKRQAESPAPEQKTPKKQKKDVEADESTHDTQELEESQVVHFEEQSAPSEDLPNDDELPNDSDDIDVIMKSHFNDLRKLGWKIKSEDLEIRTSHAEKSAGREFFVANNDFLCWVDDKKAPNPKATAAQIAALAKLGWPAPILRDLEVVTSKAPESAGRTYFNSKVARFMCWTDKLVAPIRKVNEKEITLLEKHHYDEMPEITLYDGHVFVGPMKGKNWFFYQADEDSKRVFLTQASKPFDYKPKPKKAYYMQ